MSLPLPMTLPTPTSEVVPIQAVELASVGMSPLATGLTALIVVVVIICAAWAFRCVTRLARGHLSKKNRGFGYETGIWFLVLMTLAAMTAFYCVPLVATGLYEVYLWLNGRA